MCPTFLPVVKGPLKFHSRMAPVESWKKRRVSPLVVCTVAMFLIGAIMTRFGEGMPVETSPWNDCGTDGERLCARVSAS